MREGTHNHVAGYPGRAGATRASSIGSRAAMAEWPKDLKGKHAVYMSESRISYMNTAGMVPGPHH